MKQKFLAIAIAAVFAACNSNPKTSTQTTSAAASDTGFKNSAAADRGQVIELKGVNDTIVTGDGSRYVKVDTSSRKQTLVKSETPVRTQRETVHHTAHHTSSSSSSTSSGNGGSSGGGYSGSGTSGAGTSTVESTPIPAKKKGWSKAAKGTAIGAGTGAIAGALISKKKGLGAVIGGVVGGAGGYIIGRNKDKKDGRY